MNTAVRSTLFALLPASLLFFAPGTGGAQAPPSLFVSFDPADGVLSSPGAIQEYGVEINLDALSTASRLNLNLPDDTLIPMITTGIERRDRDDYTWRGSLTDAARTDATITVRGDAVAGLIHTPNGVFQIIPGPDGSHRLAEFDDSLFPDCAGTGTPTKALVGDVGPAPGQIPGQIPGQVPGQIPGQVAGQAPGPEGVVSVADILALYTDDSRAGAGGTAAIEATLQNATDMANTAYANSGAAVRLNLIHMEEIDFTETGNIINDISTVRNTPALQQLRDTVGADMVGLVTETGSFCGYAVSVQNNPGPGFAANAWQITRRNCAAGTLTWTHEFGHLQGLQHDPANGQSPTTAAFPWAYGHFVSGEFRTVMSYSNQCTGGCPQVPQFSNPTIDYQGHPTGIVDQRENYRVLNFTAPIVAAFRETNEVFSDGFESGSTTAWTLAVSP